jgi:hypothetical protein
LQSVLERHGPQMDARPPVVPELPPELPATVPEAPVEPMTPDDEPAVAVTPVVPETDPTVVVMVLPPVTPPLELLPLALVPMVAPEVLLDGLPVVPELGPVVVVATCEVVAPEPETALEDAPLLPLPLLQAAKSARLQQANPIFDIVDLSREERPPAGRPCPPNIANASAAVADGLQPPVADPHGPLLDSRRRERLEAAPPKREKMPWRA